MTRGTPGSRVPYAWLSAEVSTVDCCAGGFALLLGPEGEPGVRGGSVAIFRIPHEALHRFGIGPSGAVLVRPDGFVAWRAESDAAASPEELRRVLGSPIAA